MKPIVKPALIVIAAVFASQLHAQVTLYEHINFQGQSFTTNRQVGNLARSGFNDRASSVIVAGGEKTRWEVCDDIRLGGRCMILRPGQYPSLSAMGLNELVPKKWTLRSEFLNLFFGDSKWHKPTDGCTQSKLGLTQ